MSLHRPVYADVIRPKRLTTSRTPLDIPPIKYRMTRLMSAVNMHYFFTILHEQEIRGCTLTNFGPNIKTYFVYYLHRPHNPQSVLVAVQQQTIQRQHNKIKHYHLDKQKLNIKIKDCIITI